MPKETKKECKKCKKLLPTKEFPKDNRAKDKLWRFCRACESARKKEARLKAKSDKPDKKTKEKPIGKIVKKANKKPKTGIVKQTPGKLVKTDGFGKPIETIA
jgi:hypothetical protein